MYHDPINHNPDPYFSIDFVIDFTPSMAAKSSTHCQAWAGLREDDVPSSPSGGRRGRLTIPQGSACSRPWQNGHWLVAMLAGRPLHWSSRNGHQPQISESVDSGHRLPVAVCWSTAGGQQCPINPAITPAPITLRRPTHSSLSHGKAMSLISLCWVTATGGAFSSDREVKCRPCWTPPYRRLSALFYQSTSHTLLIMLPKLL